MGVRISTLNLLTRVWNITLKIYTGNELQTAGTTLCRGYDFSCNACYSNLINYLLTDWTAQQRTSMLTDILSTNEKLIRNDSAETCGYWSIYSLKQCFILAPLRLILLAVSSWLSFICQQMQLFASTTSSKGSWRQVDHIKQFRCQTCKKYNHMLEVHT